MTFHAGIKPWFAIALICLLGIIAYGNILGNKFAFDDYTVIEVNDQIVKLSNFDKLFSHDYFTFAGEKSYRPLVTLTYMIDGAIWKKNAVGYHLSNLVLHILSALVLLFLTRLLIKDNIVALIASLLFVCHPLMTEAVCSITFREDVLCSLFFWIALYGYIHYRQTGRTMMIGVMLAAYLLSILSKEMGLAFIPVLIVYELFYRKRPESFVIYSATVASILVITGFFLLLRFNWMKNPDDFFNASVFSVVTLIKTLLLYWQLYVLPVTLRVIYYPQFMLSYWTDILFLLIAMALTAGGFFVLRPDERKQAAILILMSLAALAPVLNVYPIRHPIAERYTYLPAFGVMICYALVIRACMRRFDKRWVFAVLTLLLLCYTGRTMARNIIWEDNFSLWSKTTRQNPWAVEAHYSLGHAYQMRGEIPLAIKEYSRTLQLDPEYFDAHVNLGRAFMELEPPQFHKAIERYLIALRINPKKAIVHFNLGVAYGKVNDDKRSIYHYMQAIEYDPSYIEAYNSLGGYFAKRGEVERAAAYWNQAVTLDPTFAQGFANLGSLYANVGDYQKARFYWQKALQINPSYEKVKRDLSTLEKSIK